MGMMWGMMICEFSLFRVSEIGKCQIPVSCAKKVLTTRSFSATMRVLNE